MLRGTIEVSRARVACVVAGLAILAVLWASIDTIPPDAGTRAQMIRDAWTRTQMIRIEQRIREFAAVYHRLPHSLSELPNLRDGGDNSIVDVWGRPIAYAKEGRTVTLLSLGKDGRPGGRGRDADIRATFSVSLNEKGRRP